MKPLIGIVSLPTKNNIDRDIYEVTNRVVEWVVRSGGIPIGIFPLEIEDFQNKRLRDIRPMTIEEKNELSDVLSMCDGIIKPGARRIYEHDRFIYSYALENDIPYLGICAGMQTMACYKKEMIENEPNKDNFHQSEEEYVHKVKILKDTKLYNIINKEEISVNSKHSQHIVDSGIHKVSAMSEDGIIEAIENEDATFNIGVQWHPEILSETDENSVNIFNAFIKSASERKEKLHND